MNRKDRVKWEKWKRDYHIYEYGEAGKMQQIMAKLEKKLKKGVKVL